MPTRTHRIVRKLSPFLDRAEPYAIFMAYIGVGIMAFFVWLFPPKVSNDVGDISLFIEGLLLSIGFLLGMGGHIMKRSLIEFYGLCASTGGITIFLSTVFEIIIYQHQYNYGQIVGLVLLAMALMFSHGFKLYHDITHDWINLKPEEIASIYSSNH